TPILTNGTNAASSAVSGPLQYMRVGNVVTVSGVVIIAATSTGITEVHCTLPIPSSIGNAYEVAGTMGSAQNGEGIIFGNPAQDKATFAADRVVTSNLTYYFSFTYLIA